MNSTMASRIAVLCAALALTPFAQATSETTPISPAELSKLKADANYSDAAQYRLGMLYLRGERGVEKDRERAQSLLKNAALQGHTEAAYELGYLISRTPGADGDQAMRWLRVAANKNLPKAQYALGDLYVHSGEPGLAVQWYEKATAQGHIEAKRQLAALLVSGSGVAKDEKRGIALLRDAAEKGDADAQYKLCAAYQNGLGVEKDAKQSMDWLKKAAEGGHTLSQRTLGHYYVIGAAPLQQDRAEAEKWFRKAIAGGDSTAQELLDKLKTTPDCMWDDLPTLTAKAKAGNAEACRALSTRYALGEPGLPQDEKLALHWLKKAAEGGDSMAQHNLGAAYFNGTGVAKDEKAASAWLKKAAEGGYAESQYTLAGHLLCDSHDNPESRKWLGLAAAQGHVQAQTLLNELRQSDLKKEKELRALTAKAEAGDAVAQRTLGKRYLADKDEARALIWLTKAAEQDDVIAQIHLSMRLTKKRGAENEAAAIRWLSRAINQGSKPAMVALGMLQAQSTDGNKNDIEAEKWIRRGGAAAGCASHFTLGRIYTRNEGVNPDDVEAFARFSLAAETAPADSDLAHYSTTQRDEIAAKLGPRLEEANARLKAIRAELAAESESKKKP